MAAPVKPIRPKGGRPKGTGEEVRANARHVTFTDDEYERITWAAKELGLPVAAFLRMSALKYSKEVLG